MAGQGPGSWFLHRNTTPEPTGWLSPSLQKARVCNVIIIIIVSIIITIIFIIIFVIITTFQTFYEQLLIKNHD